MIELPESYVISKQLEETIKGKIIQKVLVHSSPHKFTFYFDNTDFYPLLLLNQKIDSVTPIAGYIELTCAKTKLVLGDGVNIRYLKPTIKPPSKHQLLLQFDDTSHIVCTVSMYGCIWAFQEGTNDTSYYQTAKNKPTPFSKEFNKEYFYELFSQTSPSASVKAFLATQQRIPGLGNGVLQDILFYAKIHPQSKLKFLSAQQVDTLFASIKNTLTEMAQKKGRNTEKTLFGQYGGYQTILSNKSYGSPCP